MLKVILSIVLFIATSLFAPVNAQMMGTTTSTTDTAQTAQDEAAGKAVWDKLQNKEKTCKDLKDDDFDVLGDFFMGNMIGSNHASMNNMMAQRLGDEGEKQMHIAMGKRLSGCDTNATLPEGSGYFTPMMGFSSVNGTSKSGSWRGGANGMMGYGNVTSDSFRIFGTITGLMLLAFLTLGSIHFWKEIQKKK